MVIIAQIVKILPTGYKYKDINIQKKKDYSNLYTSKVTKFSGKWNNTDNTGTFYFNLNNTSSNSNTNITAHLTFSKILLLSPIRFCRFGLK